MSSSSSSLAEMLAERIEEMSEKIPASRVDARRADHENWMLISAAAFCVVGGGNGGVDLCFLRWPRGALSSSFRRGSQGRSLICCIPWPCSAVSGDVAVLILVGDGGGDIAVVEWCFQN